MLIAHIAGSTRILGKPHDWDDNQTVTCASLPIRDIEIDGANVMVSAWTPTPDEIRAIVAGAPVLLYVWGRVHPPVAVVAGEPTP